MDFATIIGVLAGVGLILTSLQLSGGVAGYLNVPSFLIVIGGTIAATLINFPLKQVLSVLKVVQKVINPDYS